MTKHHFFIWAFLVTGIFCYAQQDGTGVPKGGGGSGGTGGGYGGGGTGGGGKFKMPAIGHIFGKVIDAKTKESLPYTPVAIYKRDSVIAGCMTKDNGEFSLENLPFGRFTVKISALGYEAFKQVVIITSQNDEQDLGNIKIAVDEKVIKEVEVTAEKSASTISIDRRVFNVGADITTHGGTAEDAMKNIPSVTIDASGNPQLRQQAATIYIDGRPTTLSLDQIPADQIDRIEVITNPSAKFEASATGGILNIVMKENNKPGYNGVLAGGVGSSGAQDGLNRSNGMVVLNYKQKPWGISLNYNYNAQNNPITGVYTDRTTYDNGVTMSNYHTQDIPTYGRTFQRGAATLDYYLNNRNTLSLSQEIVAGQFNSPDYQTFKNLPFNNNPLADSTTSGNRNSPATMAMFNNYTTKLHYRKTFPKKGEELTADANFNTIAVNTAGNIGTNTFYGEDYTSGIPYGPYTQSNPQSQTTSGHSVSQIYTEQVDFVNPINDSTKLELGLRSNYKPSLQSQTVTDNYAPPYTQVRDSILSSSYKIQDMVNAAYINYTAKALGWNYALGLRFEDSYYKSTQTGSTNAASFEYNYPSSNSYYPNGTLNPNRNKDSAVFHSLLNSLFPSFFLTKKISSNKEFQFNISRKINRPNFRQMMPFITASDARDYSIGNPDLAPEMITMAELNLNITFDKGNFFFAIFGRNSTNALTPWIAPEQGNPDVLVTTTINGTYSNTIGMDNTLKYTVFKGFEMTLNMNLLYSKISATGGTTYATAGSVKDSTSTNEGIYGIAKLNLIEHLPKNWTIQLSGSYESPKPLPQGYALPIYFADCGVSKEIKKFITISGSVSDIFNTKFRGTYISNNYSGNELFNYTAIKVPGPNSGIVYAQEQVARRDTRYVKVTVSIKFGKADASLFKRKKKTDNPDDSEGSPF